MPQLLRLLGMSWVLGLRLLGRLPRLLELRLLRLL
jgi:hypothetical protein